MCVLTCCPFFYLFFIIIIFLFEQKSSPGDSPSGAQPEFCIDLNGAVLEHDEKASSRRNVFLLTAMLGGLQVLLQCDSAQQEDEWFKAIQKAIKDLVSKKCVSFKHETSKAPPSP